MTLEVLCERLNELKKAIPILQRKTAIRESEIYTNADIAEFAKSEIFGERAELETIKTNFELDVNEKAIYAEKYEEKKFLEERLEELKEIDEIERQLEGTVNFKLQKRQRHIKENMVTEILKSKFPFVISAKMLEGTGEPWVWCIRVK